VDRPSAAAETTARPAGRRRRLTGNARKTILTIHIASAVSLLGASSVLFVGGLFAATRDERAEAHGVYQALRLLTVSFDIPAAVITLIAGLTLALTGWGLRTKWVSTKLAIYIVTVTLGVAVVGPGIDRMLEITEASGPAASAARWRPVAAAGAQIPLILTAVTLAVFKPGGRSSWRWLARG
jgi:uncharacterized membrane protein